MNEHQWTYDELDEMEAIVAYDAAKGSDDEIIPFGQAVLEIERDRQ